MAFHLKFEASDLDRKIADVFPKNIIIDLATYKAAEYVDYAFNEVWSRKITDDLVNGLGFFKGGVAEFKTVYEQCQAQHAIMYPHHPDETLRASIESFRDKVSRHDSVSSLVLFWNKVCCCQTQAVPAVPTNGGDLVEFMRGFTIEQLLVYGW